MFESIIDFSVRQKFIIILFVISIITGGIYALMQLPVDAVPDITNNQVQVVTVSPTLAPQEVEQLITFPIEVSLSNIPDVIEIRSISRYGLSVITVVFEESMEQLDARQFVQEQLNLAAGEIPDGLGNPELMPITTGLGEIYQYTLEVEEEYRDMYSPMELRTLQDWVVKRQLSGIPGIIEISSFGGFLKQYEVSVNPLLLRSFELTLSDVFTALDNNNQNSGGSYIEKNTNAYYIRSEGRIEQLSDIEDIVIKHQEGNPVLIKDIAEVTFGSPKRYGAMTKDGLGEAVGGIALMLKGANSSQAIKAVQERVERVQLSLPKGVKIAPYLDRSDLVSRTIDTVSTNLIEGGLIVIFVLLLFLGNWRAAFIVATVIPLAMLFAFILMNLLGVSANLMSLGAIDFGIVVDGAVIIVENALHILYTVYLGKKLSQSEMNHAIKNASSQIYQSAAFGVLIILVVFLPIITLTGVEGKTFRPMALTVSFALLGALVLSLTYVPMMASWIFKKHIKEHVTFSDRMMNKLKSIYEPSLNLSMKWSKAIIASIAAIFIGAVWILSTLGAEFIPTLEEGDLAMQMTIPPGSSLDQSIKTSTHAERLLLENFPEVKNVVSKIGTSEVPTDPMAIEDADIMIILKPKSEWTSASDREGLVAEMKKVLEEVPGASFDFTQPIQLRFNELMTGAKTDIAIKIFGENVEELARLANSTAAFIEDIPGAADIKVEQTEGLSQAIIHFNRKKIAQYNLDIATLNQTLRTAYAGQVSGVVFENEKKFDLVVRFRESDRTDIQLNKLFVTNKSGDVIPMHVLAEERIIQGPMQITREDAKRRITIGVNVRNRDVASLVEDIEKTLGQQLTLPVGYYITYGGQFENLQAAQKTLSIAVPTSLFLILLLLYFAFGSTKYALLIFMSVPMSAIGGVAALWLRGMPFSISAGVGFIALFGVAVLNGIVLISYFNQLRKDGFKSIQDVVVKGSLARLRPVLMTAAVAAFGFLPMALSSSAGAEVQKPLASVVIGGLVSSTLLTLIVLPNMYILFNRNFFRKASLALVLFLCIALPAAQAQNSGLSLATAKQLALENNGNYKNLALGLEQSQQREKGTFNLGLTSLTWQNGQIDGEFNDYNLQFVQNLGNLFQMVAAKKTAEAQTRWLEAQQTIEENLLLTRVQSEWFNWFYAVSRQDQLAEILPALERLEEQIAKARALGEVNFKDALTFENLLIRLRSTSLTLLNEAEVAHTSLQSLIATPIQSKPADFELNNWLSQTDKRISSRFMEQFQAEQTYYEQLGKEAESGKLPSFNIGYFNQSLNKTTGFDGFIAGISLPLFNARPKADKAIADLEAEKSLNTQNQEMLTYQNTLEQLQKQKERLLEALQIYPDPNRFSTQFDQLMSLIQKGEINVFEWTRLVETLWLNRQQVSLLEQQLTRIQSQIEFLTQ